MPKNINLAQDFKDFCEKIRRKDDYKDPIAFGIARIDRGQIDPSKTLQATFAVVNYKESFLSAAALAWALGKCDNKVDFSQSEFVADITPKVIKKAWKLFCVFENEIEKHKNVQVARAIKNEFERDLQGCDDKFKVVFIFEDAEPKSVEAAYLKLYLLSSKKAPPKSLILNGVANLLPNVAWTAQNKPIELEWLRQNEISLKMSGEYPAIVSVDKFPRFLSHIIAPDNTCVTDNAKLPLGICVANTATLERDCADFYAQTADKA